MKNKLLISIISVFFGLAICIIMTEFFNTSTKKKYYFERIFNSKSILKFDKSYPKMDRSEYVMYLRSDSNIVERDRTEIDEKNSKYKFYFSDLSFSKKVIKTLVLPNNFNIILCNQNKLFYSNKLILNCFDFDSKKTIKYRFKDLKIISLKFITETKYLCLAEAKNKQNNYNTGFFIIDISNNTYLCSKILETNSYSICPENALMYSGTFSYNMDTPNKIISYCCDKYSSIYFFDCNGNFTKELNTKENVPLPQILRNTKGDSFYGRSGTWSTNSGMFMNDDDIYVFSTRSDFFTKIIIDQYSYKTLEYKNSFKLIYNKSNSNSIRNVYKLKNKILIGFEFNYASFIF